MADKSKMPEDYGVYASGLTDASGTPFASIQIRRGTKDTPYFERKRVYVGDTLPQGNVTGVTAGGITVIPDAGDEYLLPLGSGARVDYSGRKKTPAPDKAYDLSQGLEAFFRPTEVTSMLDRRASWRANSDRPDRTLLDQQDLDTGLAAVDIIKSGHDEIKSRNYRKVEANGYTLHLLDSLGGPTRTPTAFLESPDGFAAEVSITDRSYLEGVDPYNAPLD